MAANYQKDMVVYQIYPRSFQDSNGDGIGDIPGIISRLDYLQDLGVNTLWLSPIYKSPDADNGYDIADYKAIQPAFGTMADFDELVAKAKERGIGIVMDLVINHTSDEHIWFQKAMENDPIYRDYYIIQKGKKGKRPNNWGNFFAQCPWTQIGDTDEYYLHLFDKKQPDLNWHNPAVLEEVEDIMRFWLKKGVVGFRCDVINIIYKNTLANGKKRLALTGQEHYVSTEGCHEILRKLRREVLEPYGAFAVGETVLVDITKAKDLCDEERGELDMLFSFEHMGCDDLGLKWFKTRLKPKKLMRTLDKWQQKIQWNAWYFENHDQPRFVSRFTDGEKYRCACSTMMAGLQMTLRGTPYLHEGQEIGMVNGDFQNLDEIQDVESHTVWAMAKKLGIPKGIRWKMIRRTSRDNGRTPMQWSDEENAGFTTGTPWLKINRNYRYVNAARELEDERGVRAFWKYMIGLRKSEPALGDGAYCPVYMKRNIYAFERVAEGKRLLTICNLSARKVRLPKHLAAWKNVLASNYDHLGEKHLEPFEFRLMQEEVEYCDHHE